MQNKLVELQKVLFKALRDSDLRPFERAIARTKLRMHVALMEVQEFILESAVEEGLVTAAQANKPFEIDWDQLLEFITKLIPLILQIISLF
jgi:hypothetical protein